MDFKRWLIAEMNTRPKYGWLSPRGNFYEVPQFGHLQAINQHIELKKFVPKLEDELSKLDQIERDSEELIARGEHPEWHCYEMAKSQLEYEVLDALYGNGCLRVGTSGHVMYFEGFPEAIKNLKYKAETLAEEYGMTAKFEPRKRW